MNTPLKQKAVFRLGQIVYHPKFRYRGVIVDADPYFQGTEEWYETVSYTHLTLPTKRIV